ncbi:hypothetical protein T458_09060 [Brevibacillus panacihumi W25]|uniref:DUF3995 domain-containing protein n=1 Tax=Brevibacillus panacihumi W25 TaxID=1408254 RepID=V6M7Z9_9BACL|nr:DUF3995 domain-containing protein [Brevibacillus panacihumi]EST54686.1 hypothetical protein T458_09060 [Brevibacillus panacihumi W25]
MRWWTTWFIYAGMVWTLLFAFMSFYWAAGGMMGVKSLGGQIYQMAMDRDPEFIPVVWATGVVKLGGLLLLFCLMRSGNPRTKLSRWLAYSSMSAGILMILYGVGNFITISLAAIHVLDFDLEPYAIRWRLLFWEPFWIVGGIFYVFAGYGKNQLKN